MPEDWSRDEVEATVAAYLEMLDQELGGVAFNKSDARRRLVGTLNGRSEGAIERKHQNVSAILIELGFPYVRGYKPLSNYQRLLYDVIRDRLAHAPALAAAIRARAEQPIVAPPQAAGDLLSRLVERPEPPESRRGPATIADRPRAPRLTNYLELEARNRLLGLAGEEFAVRFESERLWRAGQKQLADRIEHVSRTRGDGEGYDILSYEENGRERLVEVKTTTFGEHTPFFVTRNEVDVCTNGPASTTSTASSTFATIRSCSSFPAISRCRLRSIRRSSLRDRVERRLVLLQSSGRRITLRGILGSPVSSQPVCRRPSGGTRR